MSLPPNQNQHLCYQNHYTCTPGVLSANCWRRKAQKNTSINHQLVISQLNAYPRITCMRTRSTHTDCGKLGEGIFGEQHIPKQCKNGYHR